MAGEWKVTQEKAKKVILHAEKSQKMFRKLKAFIKPNQASSLKNILVPKPCIETNPEIDDNKAPLHRWADVVDVDSVFDLMLKKNAQSLMRSCDSITATGHICDLIGYEAEHTEFIDSLLKGNVDAAELAANSSDLTDELEKFLRSCTKTNDADMAWTFNQGDYQSLFKATRENTACGPSGLHMSHWKAMAMDDQLSEINAFFMWAAFYLGFVYDRWLISWHCMLLKKKHPFLTKLRIIQLFEGDFNGMLKSLLGRQLMRHMVATDQIDITTFGSIPGKDAKEAMKLLDMIYTNHRLFSRTLVTIFNDAAGCYDRIRPNMADIAMRRVGCPASIAKTQTLAQIHMEHKVKTAMGISKGSIKWNPGPLCMIILAGIAHYIGNIGGIGQGGGGSPVGWLVILLIMIRAYRHFSKGAQIIDPLGDNTFTLHVVSYVDDNSLLRSFPSGVSLATMLQTVSRELTSWWKLLRITGGDLALEKCLYSVMSWKWTGYYNDREMVTLDDCKEEVTVHPSDSDPITISRLPPTKAERQLGIRLSMEGN